MVVGAPIHDGCPRAAAAVQLCGSAALGRRRRRARSLFANLYQLANQPIEGERRAGTSIPLKILKNQTRGSSLTLFRRQKK